MNTVNPKDRQTIAAECRNRAVEVEAIKESLLKSRDLLSGAEDSSVFMSFISLGSAIDKLGIAAEILSETADKLYKDL